MATMQCTQILGFFYLPQKAREYVYRCWFVCLSVCAYVPVTTITNKIVDGFVPTFTRRFLVVKRSPRSCFVTTGRDMWK